MNAIRTLTDYTLVLVMTYLTTVQHIGEKFLEIVKYPISWLAGFFLFLMNAVAGGQLLIYIIILASTIDLACGISVSVRRNSFTYSELIRQTVEKVTVYGLAMLVFLSIDQYIGQNTDFDLAITSGVVGVVITMAETWSFLAALLILFPNNVFLKLLQKALTGEIARKLGCDEIEVAKLLKMARTKRDSKGRFVEKKPVHKNREKKPL